MPAPAPGKSDARRRRDVSPRALVDTISTSSGLPFLRTTYASMAKYSGSPSRSTMRGRARVALLDALPELAVVEPRERRLVLLALVLEDRQDLERSSSSDSGTSTSASLTGHSCQAPR